MTTEHPFTKFGPGPYAYVSYELRAYQACPGAPWQPGATCDHCGAGIKHVYWCKASNGATFKVGSTCVGKTLEAHTQLGRDIMRQKKLIERQARRARKQAKHDARKAQWRRDAWTGMRSMIAQHPDLTRILRTDNPIVRDIRARFIQWGSISDKQLELLRRIAGRVQAEAERVYVPVPNGKHTVTGIVVSTKYQENNYHYGSTLKMLVRVVTPAGDYKLWGTCPAKLADTPGDPKGKQVTFTATLQRSNDDDSFGFFKRPTKVSIK